MNWACKYERGSSGDTKSQSRLVPCRGFPCHVYSYLSSMGFQRRTSHVPPVLTLALFSIGRARCAPLGFSALALVLTMVVVGIAGEGSGIEQTGKAAARQLALEPISSDKCTKAPTSLLEIQMLCCIYRFRFFNTWR